MLRVGILGAGGMGNVHARQYRKMPDVELEFFEPNPDKAQAFMQRWDCGHAASAEEVIKTCDVIDVCLPTDLHLEFGLKAIAAGRAVLVEKPMAGAIEDAMKLVKAADDAGVALMPAQVVRFFPEFAAGNRQVREGKVGKPGAARTHRGGMAPTGEGSWFMDHSRSGGVLLDVAIHDFDWLRWTLGEVKSLYSRSLGATTGTGPDYALTTLTFEDGCVAHVESTWMDPGGYRVTFEVCGSEGMIEFDSRTNAALRTNTSGKPVSEGALVPTDDPYYRQLKGFVNAVRSSSPPPVAAYDGYMAVSIALTALESARTGKALKPPRG